MIKGRISIKPLSINRYYVPLIVGRHVEIKVSLQGKAYKKECSFKLLPKLSKLEKAEKYFVGYIFGFSNAASDADNAVKPFQDALVDAYNAKFGKSLNDKQFYFPISQKVKVPIGQEFIEFFVAPLTLYADMMRTVSEKMENDNAFELFFKYITPQSL